MRKDPQVRAFNIIRQVQKNGSFHNGGKKKEFEEELKYLKNEGRKNAVKRFRKRAFGDLSENAEYDIAKAEQGKLEARIVELEGVLSNCEVYEKKLPIKSGDGLRGHGGRRGRGRRRSR